MNDQKPPSIKSFTDLKTWQEGHQLVLMVYQATKHFPKQETYALVDQMQRAAISITSNIAEGFGRQSYKEKVQFFYLAQGSLTELKNQLLVSRDVGYLDLAAFNRINNQANTAHCLLYGLIKKSKTYIK
jgi:four helix bundle protein